MAGKLKPKAKAKTPLMAKAKGAAAAAAAAVPSKAGQSLVVPVVKSSALSLDVGLFVLKSLDSANKDEAQAKDLLAGVKTKRLDVISKLTLGIVKAATNDKSIVLDAVFKEKKDMATLNNQLGIALGFREVVTVGDGDKAKQRVDWTKEAAALVSANKDDSEDMKRRKGTLRSNFMTLVKRCGQTAIGIIEGGSTAKIDKASGVLAITGPAVKSQFGQDTVLLNEKQTVQTMDKKGKVTGEKKLKEKPSFTAIAAKAATAHGKNMHRGSNTRGAGAALSNPTEHVKALCKSLVAAIGKLVGKPSAEVIAAFDSVESAMDVARDMRAAA